MEKILAIEPIKDKGLKAVLFGNILWFASLLSLLFYKDTITRTGHENWIYIALSGLIIGILGHLYIHLKFRIQMDLRWRDSL